MNTTAFEEGYKAYENYQHLSDNPHECAAYNQPFEDWEAGFIEARAIDNGDV